MNIENREAFIEMAVREQRGAFEKRFEQAFGKDWRSVQIGDQVAYLIAITADAFVEGAESVLPTVMEHMHAMSCPYPKCEVHGSTH